VKTSYLTQCLKNYHRVCCMVHLYLGLINRNTYNWIFFKEALSVTWGCKSPILRSVTYLIANGVLPGGSGTTIIHITQIQASHKITHDSQTNRIT
jgi:hypothetical protein